MEAMRNRLLKDPDLFVPQKPPQRPVASSPSDTNSVISISSESSEPTVVQAASQAKTKRQQYIVISDDEDNDTPVLGNSNRNAQLKYPTPTPSQPRKTPLNTTPIPIPVPQPGRAPVYAPAAGRDPVFTPHGRDPAPVPVAGRIPLYPNAVRPTYPPSRDTDHHEVLNVRDVGQIPDVWMSAEETEKALRDLMADARTDIKVDIQEEDAIVPGFRPEIQLKPHQIVARHWMKERETGKRCGGILADDMGLGKTIETITRIVEGIRTLEAKADGYAKATLVVCPVAVVGQWAEEIRKMTKNLVVMEHHGSSRTTDPDKLKRVDVVITSYSIVANEYGTYSDSGKDESKSKKSKKGDDDDDSDESDGERFVRRLKPASKQKDALFRVKWWRVVLDEAHNIKNKTTKSAIACCALESKYRWCLSGTPMQNSVDELYSLIKFLRIKPLNDWATFKEQISDPIKKNRPQRAIKRLHVVLNACMLRRTKTTILNGEPILKLPKRAVEIVDCDFNPEERGFYNNVQTLVEERLETMKQNDIQKSYTTVLVMLLRLRQACNHPSLVSKDYREDKEALQPKAAKNDDDIDDNADDLADLMGGLGLAGAGKRCQMCQTFITSKNAGSDPSCCSECDTVFAKSKSKLHQNSDLPPTSAKIRKILELVQAIEDRGEGEKTIIFSQFTSMLDIIEPFLKDKGFRYVRYDGSMRKPDRDAALEKIRNSSKTRIILISFKAGSTGLNLTACNNVILVDMWWNPALEDQAFDRAHRMGQERDVNIYKLTIPDTVEQRILDLQEKKRALATAALAGDKMKNMKLGINDLLALFRHGGDDGRDDDD